MKAPGPVICFFLIALYVSLPRNLSGISTEIVVSRYNEDLNWLNNTEFFKHPVICYNKGKNENFTKSKNIKKIVNYKNVGRCDHTYLYHIVTNFEVLPDVTIFLPGSLNIPFKMKIAKRLLYEVERRNTSVFIGYFFPEGVFEEFKNFELNDWKATDLENRKENPESVLKKSEFRPFSKWYQKHFKNIHVKYTSFFGILSVSRGHIIQHPKSYYEKLLEELDNHSNPEVGHYFERAWGAVFYPMKYARFLNA